MRGFTLLELLAGALITTILAAAVFLVLSSGDATFRMDAGWVDLQQEARRGINAMVSPLREASGVVITSDDASSDRITFNTTVQSGIVIYRDSDARQIIRTAATGTPQVLANDNDALNITLSGDVLRIAVQHSRSVYSRPTLTFNLTERIVLRNE